MFVIVPQNDGDADIDNSELDVILILTDPDNDASKVGTLDCVFDVLTDCVAVLR